MLLLDLIRIRFPCGGEGQIEERRLEKDDGMLYTNKKLHKMKEVK
jgi:hypothetical protein